MGWNYCPHCAHRIYAHGKDGCEHVDVVIHQCHDAGCPSWVHTQGEPPHGHEVRTSCDCTVPHPFLTDERIH